MIGQREYWRLTLASHGKVRRLYLYPRHLVMRQHELFKNEYSIVNDSAHGFSLFTYYIGKGEQPKQLERNVGKSRHYPIFGPESFPTITPLPDRRLLILRAHGDTFAPVTESQF
ncbi:MAG: hypothetical protein M3R69_17145 [Acidobacteriota bacterium]|nr:hypothetical protein [Acidobacteriota bacterium]